MEYVKSGVEVNTQRGVSTWREYVRWRESETGPDGKTREVWKKRRRLSPVALRKGRDGKPTAASRKAAEKSAERWRAELNAQEADREERGEEAIALQGESVAHYVSSYVDRAEAGGSLEPSTVRCYRMSAKHIAARFSDVAVTALRPRAVADWLADLGAQGKSSSTIGKAFRLLRMAMSDAIALRVIDTNPTDGVKPPARGNVKQGINALSASTASALISQLAAMEPTAITVAALIALQTGLREGEVCGLQWRDVDFTAGTIWVRRAIGAGKGGCYVKQPKTGKARDVIMTPTLAGYLSRLKASRVHDTAPNSYVIPNADGGFQQPGYIGRGWTTLSRVLGVTGCEGRRATFHDLRHTWATLAIANGVDVKTVSSNLGHANAAMTLNVYASADPDAKTRAAVVMEKVFSEHAADVLRFRTGTEG